MFSFVEIQGFTAEGKKELSHPPEGRNSNVGPVSTGVRGVIKSVPS